MKKLLYIADIRLPTEKAHGIQIMKMCEAFAREGVEVELVVPRRRNHIEKDSFQYYGVEKSFTITKLPTIDLVGIIPKIGFWIEAFVFSFFTFLYTKRTGVDIVYSRDELPLFFISFLKEDIVWETHTNRWNFLIRRITKKVERIVAITQGLKNFFVQKGVYEEKIIVAHDGFDPADFTVEKSKEDLRKDFNLPRNKKLIGYVGMLRTMGEEKGVGTVLQALQKLPEDYMFVIVGGNDKDIAFYRKKAKTLGVSDRVEFIGKVPHKKVPFYLKACDVLVAPYPSTHHYSRYMSPLKIFEYMASGTPIVTSKLPSIKEVMGKENAILVKPGSVSALYKGIKRAIDNREGLGHQAEKDVQEYTWRRRANNILSFIYE